MRDHDLPEIDPKWGRPSYGHDPYVLAHFRARPTDVLITTAPKAGTTWMQQILHQLRSGGDPEFDCIYDEVPWLELPQQGRHFFEVLEEYERLPDPRVFKTHCTYDQTPGVDTARIVLTSRDPRDCFVSFYHHLQDMTDEAHAMFSDSRPPREVEAVFAMWMTSRSWYRNVESWWPHRRDPNVLWLRFEEMKGDLAGAIDRVVAHLGWEVGPEARSLALDYSSFEWMAAHRDKFTRLSAGAPASFKPGGFIRKGAVGDREDLLTPEIERRILEETRRSLPPDCLSFLGLA